MPLFDDIFALALMSFNESATGFSPEHIQDELTGLISQTLDIDYNTVALVTDARAQKRSSLLGSEPVPELPEISEQRSVELKYREKQPAEVRQQIENNDIVHRSPESTASDSEEYETDDSDNGNIPAREHRSASGCLPGVVENISLIADVPFSGSEPQFNPPEALASLIDQTAWELAGNAGLEFLIMATETGVFDISQPESELSNEGKIYWQMLAFLAGKLPGSAIIWRQMLTGTPGIPAGFGKRLPENLYPQ